MESIERWKPVVGWPGYAVSTRGRVFSFKRGHYMAPFKTHYRWEVILSRPKARPKHIGIARAILTAFVGEPLRGQCVLYRDEDVGNIDLSNLQWGTKGQVASRLSTQAKSGNRFIRNRTMFRLTCPDPELLPPEAY
jgi:hypothetical protein